MRLGGDGRPLQALIDRAASEKAAAGVVTPALFVAVTCPPPFCVGSAAAGASRGLTVPEGDVRTSAA
eukprot:CAMPEP_0181048588 /NCGR_PEP_ID=MMETSP1070-20121207/15517_1 /TAXON_ID=265543 /ORGANISM="Minutocellus polymorphus, Strain NH13" /LENGTH=66 /DNA_ID=CAMNT_0023127385 /DNA_START=138 /DNA_END=336 /DNA_ORIENTATION=-